MKRAILFLLLLSASSLVYAQVSFDKSQVTSDTVVDFAVTRYRGIQTVEGIVYYLERDHQTLTGYAKDKILWQVNVVKTCAPKIPNAEIRYLYLTDGALKIDFGNKSHAEVNVDSGKVNCRPAPR